jgi:NitT/TauT family transport system substrate-binding protein
MQGGLGRRWVGVIASAAMAVLGVSAANAQSNAPLKIRVAGSDAINSALPFFVAQRQGYFKAAGLDVVYVTMAGGAAPMSAALKSGELDLALGAASQYMQDIARKLVPGKVIGEFTDNNYAILAKDGIKDPKQLKGKIFGISSPNAGDHLYAQAVLAHYGIGPNDVTWLSVGTPASRLSALLAGRVDGIEMTVTSLPQSSLNKVIITADDSPVPFVSNAIFARQAFIDSNKPALQRFMAAVGKGADWIRANAKDAVTPCLDSGATAEACKIAIDVALASKNPYTWSSTGKVNAGAIKEMIPIVAAVIPEAKNMTVNDFIDTTIAAGGS